MLEAIKSFTAADGSEIRANITRVAPDHELARFHPGAFRPATDGPGSDVVRRGPMPGCECAVSGGGQQPSRRRRPRLPLEQEIEVRRQTLDQIERERRDRDRQPSEQDRFWAGSDALLRNLEDPVTRQRRAREQREDREAAETAEHLAELSPLVLKLREIDEQWGSAAPWN